MVMIVENPLKVEFLEDFRILKWQGLSRFIQEEIVGSDQALFSSSIM